MRVLEALKILEAAVIDCKARNIDTPEVREALDVLQPYCQPEWRVAGFRARLKRSEEFGGIPSSVRSPYALCDSAYG